MARPRRRPVPKFPRQLHNCGRGGAGAGLEPPALPRPGAAPARHCPVPALPRPAAAPARHCPGPALPRPAAARRGEGAALPGAAPPARDTGAAGGGAEAPSARLVRSAPGEPARSGGHVLGGGPAAGPAPATARPGPAAPAAGPEGWTMNPAAAAPPPGQQVIHVTQDLDTELEALFNAVMNPRPSSWRKKILPESFFREPDSGSHSRQSSTDSGGPPPRLAPVHVRSHSSPASLPGAGAAPQHGHLRQRSCDVADERPLPPGWEMALTQTGQRYFLNHIEKITTWQDPRKPMNQALNHLSHHPAATSTPAPQRTMAMSQPNLMMNVQPQPPPSTALLQQSRPPQPPALLTLPSALTTQQQQQQQQKLRLQRIQMERERIRMRQEELLRQEAALCRQLPMDSENMVPVQTAVNTPAMTQDMRPITNNGSDPFLNSGPYHSREQSTDSGLGLGCYSIPTTPEDFLSNVDEMDTGGTIAQTTMNINPQQTRFPDFLDCLPGTNVDLGTLESEDLIPILNDVESVLNKNEPFLTWL